jgi:glycosyltransferase involved in cell wall biosynthesis
VLLQPDSYAGYCRPLLEAQACGMPVLTTNAEPMREYCPAEGTIESGLTLEWYEPQVTHGRRSLNTWRQLVTARDVATALNRTRTWMMPQQSMQARFLAETHRWKDETTRLLLLEPMEAL